MAAEGAREFGVGLNFEMTSGGCRQSAPLGLVNGGWRLAAGARCTVHCTRMWRPTCHASRPPILIGLVESSRRRRVYAR